MATDKYPNRNVNVPYSEADLQAARARMAPARTEPSYSPTPSDGKGSRRQVAQGVTIDDRVIIQGGPSSPSEDSPPDWKEGRATPPASYDPLKVYEIKLGKGIVFAGRMLSPGKSYQMTGEACTEVSAAVIDAVELGEIPVDPDAQPSSRAIEFKG
jgi:hypothetical protein